MNITKPVIRAAKENDLLSIVSLLADDALGQAREKVSDPVDKTYLDAFAAIQRDENQLLAVVEIDKIIAGCLQISFVPGLSRRGMWRAQIESVRISAGFQGHGLGQIMIEWAISKAREKDCGLVQLTSDKQRPKAIRFYEKLGFLTSHEGMKLSL